MLEVRSHLPLRTVTKVKHHGGAYLRRICPSGDYIHVSVGAYYDMFPLAREVPGRDQITAWMVDYLYISLVVPLVVHRE